LRSGRGILKSRPLNVESPLAGIRTEPPVSRTLGQHRQAPLRIQASKGWAALNLRELWSYRDLLWILVERDIKLIYKQTALGVIWVVLQPLIAAPIFALIFGRFAKLPSDGTPYLLFVFCGLTVWSYFSQALHRAGNGLVNSSHLVTKVYFPRLLIPLGHTLSAMVDFGVMLIVLGVVMAIYRVPPSLRLIAIPGIALLMTFTATGVALWFSALSVKYRDCAYALPYFIQVWMYASPVIYATSMLSPQWQTWFALNPTVGFIEAFRWAVLGRGAVSMNILSITIVMSLVILFSGAFFFRRAERAFADII
jgi:lipopolysaccharide transport system permease protein